MVAGPGRFIETSSAGWWQLFPPAVALLVYLPLLPRSFMGDDWLWLAQAQRALEDPTLFLSRPVYGYFRPLFLL